MSSRDPMERAARASRARTRVSQARRPLDRAYVLLSLLFVLALAAVVFVTVLQASPSVTRYGVGWSLDTGQTGTTYAQLGNDSPVRVPTGPDQIGFERQLFTLVNDARLKRGLTPVKYSAVLTRAARDHSADMAATQRFDPVDATGRTPLQRAQVAGYNDPQYVLEAISAGYATPEQAMNALTANANTARDLFNPDVSEIGVGYAFAREDRAFRHYWTVDLGKQSGLNFTVVVNNGNESTTSAQVTLHIGGKNWAQEMQVSNSPDYADAVWEPYAETKAWRLSEGTGPKQIYIKLRGPGGQQVEVVGTIALDPAAKGVIPGTPHSDTFAAPRPPQLRYPAGELLLSGTLPPGATGAPAASANNALTPGYYQTSEFMFGKVAVGLVMPQCNGAIDRCSETWTPAMMDQVYSQAQSAMAWWSRQMNNRVSFVFDQQRAVATGYEPIHHPQSDESLWIGDVMTHLGFTGTTYFEKVYAYNNWLRQRYQTDWAITLFIANSLNNSPGTFSNGYFAYSYVPGPFTVITYDNDGYGIGNMASVMAHETGHVFGALDQYSGANVACSATSGYLVLPNQNSQLNCQSNVESIMRGGVVPFTNFSIDQFARGMVGDRTSRGSLPDPINTTPLIAVNLPSTIASTTPTFTGTTQDQPFPSPSGNSVTINNITAVKFRVDNGAWQDAAPADGSAVFNKVSQDFVFTPTLASGMHLIEVQAFNRQNIASAIVGTTLTVQASATAPGPVPPASRPPSTATPAPPLAPPPTAKPPSVVSPPTLAAPPTVTSPPTAAASPTVTSPPTVAQPTGSGWLTIQINAGNTAVSFPASGFTASSLIAAINLQGGSATEVDAWSGRNWLTYAPGTGGADFAIEAGSGYVVKARAASTLVVPVNPATAIREIKIDQGWDMLGVTACANGRTSCYTASSLAAQINAQGGQVVEINRMLNGSWSAYQAGYSFNDFPVVVGQGYFIRANAASTWRPQ